MSLYSFKKEATLYVVFAGKKYNITVSSINFSQQLEASEFSNRTLQEPNNLFSQSIIHKASPATFELTVYAIREGDFSVLFNRALNVGFFDLYIVTKADTFKIEKCVITNTRFLIEKNGALRFYFSGQGSKLSRPGDNTYNITEPEKVRSSSQTYNRLTYVEVLLGSTAITALTDVTVELQNDISWLEEDIVSLCSESDTLVYMSNFIVNKKVLSGSFTSYNIGDRNWSTEESIRIIAGQKIGQTVYGFDFNIDSASFTNRETSGNIFSQSFDWRMTQNPASLYEVIKYITYTDSGTDAILDYLDNPILDYQNNPILESI